MTQQITAVLRRWHKGVEDLDGMDDIKLAKCYQVNPSRSRACRLHRSDWARATSCRMREKVGLMGPRNLQYWVALHPVRCSLRIVSGECLSCSSGCSHARLPLRSNWDPKSIEIPFQSEGSHRLRDHFQICWLARPGVQIQTGRYGKTWADGSMMIAAEVIVSRVLPRLRWTGGLRSKKYGLR